MRVLSEKHGIELALSQLVILVYSSLFLSPSLSLSHITLILLSPSLLLFFSLSPSHFFLQV